MAIAYSPKIVTNGLRFAIDAANPRSYPGSGTTIYDLSGNGYNGTMHGDTVAVDGWFDLKEPAATTDYITLNSNALNGLTSWTIELWLYIYATNTIDTFLTCGSGNDFLWLFNGRSTLSFQNPSDSIISYATSLTTPFLFSATGTGGSISLYKNGSYVTAFSNTTTITVNSTLGIVLGQEMDSNSGNFDASQKFRGKYGPIRFYNRALSAPEIEQNYNAQKTRFGL
jgi:hypothetical protein